MRVRPPSVPDSICFSQIEASAAPPHGEVVAAYRHGAAVDAAAAHDEVGRHEVGEVAGLVVLRLAGDGADLVERAGIEQALDALAHGELAAVMLALDLVGAAHAVRQLFAAAQVVDLGLPAHRSASQRNSHHRLQLVDRGVGIADLYGAHAERARWLEVDAEVVEIDAALGQHAQGRTVLEIAVGLRRPSLLDSMTARTGP